MSNRIYVSLWLFHSIFFLLFLNLFLMLVLWLLVFLCLVIILSNLSFLYILPDITILMACVLNRVLTWRLEIVIGSTVPFPKRYQFISLLDQFSRPWHTVTNSIIFIVFRQEIKRRFRGSFDINILECLYDLLCVEILKKNIYGIIVNCR